MTFKSIFDETKGFDTYDKLNINDELDTITFQINELYKIVAYDNNDEVYLEIMLKDKQFNHMHLDYSETRDVFMKAIVSDKPLPNENEWHKISVYNLLTGLAFIFAPLILLMILIFGLGIQTWIMPLRLLVLIGAFLLSWIAIIHLDKKYKKKNKDIYDKIKNLDFDDEK